MPHEKLHEIQKFQGPEIKLHWNTVHLIDVFVYGCFCPAVEVLSSCNRDHMWPRKLKTFTLWPFTEKVCHPCYSAVFIKMLISELLNK